MRINAVAGLILTICAFSLSSLAQNRPSAPTGVTVQNEESEFVITVSGGARDGENELNHVVVLRDLTTAPSLEYLVSKTSEYGPAYSSAESTIKILKSAQLSGRFFVAAAVSRTVDEKEVFSNWRIFCEDSVPKSLSTAGFISDEKPLPEMFLQRTRKISENDGSQVMMDLSLSIPTDEVSKHKLISDRATETGLS